MGGHSHFCHVELVERSAEGRLLPTGRKTSLRCQEYIKKPLDCIKVLGIHPYTHTRISFRFFIVFGVSKKRGIYIYILYIL